MEVATANAVPRSCSLPVVKESPSPAESRTTPVVPEKIVLAVFDAVVEDDVPTGRKRKTGRVACDDRSTHFHSSLIRAPREGPEETRSIPLNNVGRLI